MYISGSEFLQKGRSVSMKAEMGLGSTVVYFSPGSSDDCIKEGVFKTGRPENLL